MDGVCVCRGVGGVLFLLMKAFCQRGCVFSSICLSFWQHCGKTIFPVLIRYS